MRKYKHQNKASMSRHHCQAQQVCDREYLHFIWLQIAPFAGNKITAQIPENKLS